MYDKDGCAVYASLDEIKATKVQRAARNIQPQQKTKFRAPGGESSQTVNALVLLIGYSDLPFSKSKADFDMLFNQVGYSENGALGSVRDFYLEDSYGQFDVNFTVAGPFTAANTMKYYGEDISGNDAHVLNLVKEAVIFASNAGIDFTQFDNDSDGYLDNIHVVYAGHGQENGGVSTDAIWAHTGYFDQSEDFPIDGKILWHYSCASELRGSSNSTINTIGVHTHELGHNMFYAPDFYDANGTIGGSYLGTGYWDLMSSGSWNGPDKNGSCPAHTNMYQKIVNGWVNPVELTGTQTIVDMLNSSENPVAYVVKTPVENDYYVLENRQKIGFDSNIPGHGLLIYHASLTDDNIIKNTVNNTHPQKMYPVCASANGNPGNSYSSYGKIDSDGCPFPGYFGITEFTAETLPSFIAWNGLSANGKLVDITENSELISFNFVNMADDIRFLPNSEIAIYPNPLKRGECLNFDIQSDRANLAVYSLAGIQISEEVISNGSHTINLPTGVYLLKLTENGNIKTSKLVVQ
jgi:M6 family metalloprotease-like protein